MFDAYVCWWLVDALQKLPVKRGTVAWIQGLAEGGWDGDGRAEGGREGGESCSFLWIKETCSISQTLLVKDQQIQPNMECPVFSFSPDTSSNIRNSDTHCVSHLTLLLRFDLSLRNEPLRTAVCPPQPSLYPLQSRFSHSKRLLWKEMN